MTRQMTDLGPPQASEPVVAAVHRWLRANPRESATASHIAAAIEAQSGTVQVALSHLYPVLPQLVRPAVGMYAWDPDRDPEAQLQLENARLRLALEQVRAAVERAMRP